MIAAFLIAFLFLLMIEMLGYIYNNFIEKKEGNNLLIGFFLYFALFQLVALSMILMQRPLHELSVVWSGICAMILGAFLLLAVHNQKKLRKTWEQKRNRQIKWNGETGILCVVVLLTLLQIYLACTWGNNSWDTAYYIGNVVQAVDTDTMYIFDGYTGLKDQIINLRYAMSSFYMNDAVISYISGIHGAIICRFFNVLICQILSVYIVYLLGKEIWDEKKRVYAFICFWVLANMGTSTGYLASCFLLTRSYEAKAFCANVVIPAAILILLRLVRTKGEKMHWHSLFVMNLASVAISASCLMLIPFLEGIFFLAYLFIMKKYKEIGRMFVCLLPSMAYLAMYMMSHLGLLQIPIR